jgi:hypothetical protein
VENPQNGKNAKYCHYKDRGNPTMQGKIPINQQYYAKICRYKFEGFAGVQIQKTSFA